MEQIKILELSNKEIENLPLFYRKIHYNEMVALEDEEKIYIYSNQFQSETIRNEDPQVDISKTINYTLFKDEE